LHGPAAGHYIRNARSFFEFEEGFSIMGDYLPSSVTTLTPGVTPQQAPPAPAPKAAAPAQAPAPAGSTAWPATGGAIQNPGVDGMGGAPARGGPDLSGGATAQRGFFSSAFAWGGDLKSFIDQEKQKIATNPLVGGLPNTVERFLQKAGTSPEEALKDVEGMDDEALAKCSDEQLAALAGYMVEPTFANVFSGARRADLDKQFLRVLTAKCNNGEPPLDATDAGHVDAILSRMKGGREIYERLGDDAQVTFAKLTGLQVDDDGEAKIPKGGFVPTARDATPGDWSGYNAYADALSGSQRRGGTATPRFFGGLIPEGGRPKVDMAKVDAQGDDPAAREVNQGVKLLPDPAHPDGAFPQAFAAIDNAKPGERVYLSVFAFQSDSTGQQMAQHLIDAKKRGCDVKVIYDWAGSCNSNHEIDPQTGKVKLLPTDKALYDKMRAAGIPVMEYPDGPAKDQLTHRKLLVVGDQAMPFLNVGDEYSGIWNDFSWGMQGPSVVDMMNAFTEQWNRAMDRNTGDGVNLLAFAGKGPDGKPQPLAKFGDHDTDLWSRHVLSSNFQPMTDQHSIRIISHRGLTDQDIKALDIRALKTAQNRVKVTAPYTCDPDYLNTLCDTARRLKAAGKGPVVLMVPANNDVKQTKLAIRAWYPDLMAAGVEIREALTPMTHSKVKVIDDLAEGGSSNLDARSLNNNDELVGSVWDKAVADSVDKTVFEDGPYRVVTQGDIDKYKADKRGWAEAEFWRTEAAQI
jgi:phosphatidylserine/phosphatidylglycerophosphate/cardiolipin synthase-like enzyme